MAQSPKTGQGPGWGFTVKQGVTTIHEDSAAYTVWPVFMVQVDNGGGSSHLPSAELPQEETVGPHMLSSSQIQWACYKNWKVEWEAQNSYECIALDMRSDLNCWGAWDTTCGHKAKDITPSIAWRREARKEEALNDLPWKDERGPSSVRRTLEPFQRRHWGKFWETGWGAYGLFRAHRYHLELNWTSLFLSYYSPSCPARVVLEWQPWVVRELLNRKNCEQSSH